MIVCLMRHFRRTSLHPVQRIKHVVDSSATLAGGSVLNQVLVTAVDAPVIANTSEVITGSAINGIYLKIEVASNEAQDVGAVPNVYLAVFKNPGNNLSMPLPNAVGPNDNKRFFIHQEMIMIDNKLGGNPRVLFNGVIAIPKGYRRFGPNDRLVASILSPAINIAVCFQCHFKEFR